MDALVGGVVETDQDTGCIWLSDQDGARYPVIWPRGTTAKASPFAITLADGQSVQAGDRVQGGGGYVDADGATSGLGIEPFPAGCVHVGEAAVFNSGSEIAVTAEAGLNMADTLVGRFSVPESIGLELIGVNPNARSVVSIDFVTGTVHQYGPDQHDGPVDSIDGASGGGGFIHVWADGTIYSYPGRFDSEPVVYQPDPLVRVADLAPTLQVMPAPDGERTWLVQTGIDGEPTVIELINLVEEQVTRLISVETDGSWRPVGATVAGVVLVGEDSTRLVGYDGTIVAERDGIALSVGWNGAAILTSNGSLEVTDAGLENSVPADKPSEGQWVSIGGPIIPATSPPARTGTDRHLLMLADDAGKGAFGSGDLVLVDTSGAATPIFELSQGSHLASWSRDENWVVVIEDSSVTLVPVDGGTNVPLGDLVPESHWVVSAG